MNDDDHAAYMRWWRRQNRERAQVGLDPPHGLAGTYSNHLCKCDACTAAHAARLRAYAPQHVVSTRAKRAKSAAAATKANVQWTGADMEIATARTPSGQYARTAAEVGAMLGRSITAVHRIRARCLHDPRYIAAAGLTSEESP